jgi:spore coat protein U-like protein
LASGSRAALRRWPGPVFAALVGSLFLAPGATRAADCTATATSVQFGTYDTSSPLPADSTGALTITCTYVPSTDRTVLYTVALSSGNGLSPVLRWLAYGNYRLYYNLYTDAGRSQVWGDGTGGSVLASGSLKVGPGVGNGTRSNTHTVYGRIAPQQDAASGNYGDTIILTLTF